MHQWWNAYQDQGKAGLQARKRPGRPPKLSQDQRAELAAILSEGAQAYGYDTELWTLARIARVINEQFGVHYHVRYVWWLMRSLGWSCQKPQKRALERDEHPIIRWRQEVWPDLSSAPGEPAQRSPSWTKAAR